MLLNFLQIVFGPLWVITQASSHVGIFAFLNFCFNFEMKQFLCIKSIHKNITEVNKHF